VAKIVCAPSHQLTHVNPPLMMQDCGREQAGDHTFALQLLGEYESDGSEGQRDDCESASRPFAVCFG